MIHLDWLTAHQEHDSENLPILGKDICTKVDLATGELQSETITGYQHEGSYDTSIRIRCDGIKIEVSGNPSAFCKPDNLYGVLTVEEGIEVFNRVLRSLNLPEFSDSEITNPSRHQFAKSDNVCLMGGVVITRVDLTSNFSTDDVMLSLRHLSSYVHQGKAGNLYENGNTVDWNKGSKRVYIKYYSKAFDIQKKIDTISKLIRKKDIIQENTDLLEKHKLHLEKILAFCIEHQIIRHEITLKSTQIAAEGLKTIGSWTMNKIIELSEKYQFHKKQKLQTNNLNDVKGVLIDYGIPERRAINSSKTLKLWLSGEDVNFKRNPDYTKTEFYANRKVLLLLGIDISDQCNISKIPLKTKRVVLEAIEPPVWYSDSLVA